MQQKRSRLYNWAIQKAHSPKAPLWVGILFFLELVLFVPLDAILMFFCLENRKKIFLYAAIAAIASALSGLIGYLVGHFLWDWIGSYIVPHFISHASFGRISNHVQIYEHWAIFVGALIPFPLKALSLTAGVFHLGVFPFFLCLSGARCLRFLLIGIAIFIWGEKIKNFVERHFHQIVLIFSAKIAMIFLLIWAIA